MSDELDIGALEARARMLLMCVVGPSSMTVYPHTVLRLIAAVRERDALRAALEPFAAQDAKISADYDHYDPNHTITLGRYGMVLRGDFRLARSALSSLTPPISESGGKEA